MMVAAVRRLSQLTRLSARYTRSLTVCLRSSTTRTFSASATIPGKKSSDFRLVRTLRVEYEKKISSDDHERAPGFLQTFNAQGIWQLEHQSHADEVVLTRKFGDENIRLVFYISDMKPITEPTEPRLEYGYTTIPVLFSVTKSSSPESICIDTTCEDEHFYINTVLYHPNAKVGPLPRADWKQRWSYHVSQPHKWLASVEDEVDNFLSKRGIAESLVSFIFDYVEYQKQRKYIRWLKNVKTFVEV